MTTGRLYSFDNLRKLINCKLIKAFKNWKSFSQNLSNAELIHAFSTPFSLGYIERHVYTITASVFLQIACRRCIGMLSDFSGQNLD